MEHKTRIFILIIFGLLLFGCKNSDDSRSRPEIAVTNSYLEAAVKDLFGSDIEILCLAPPGMCPGHFDFSPSQTRQLKDCRLLLFFDFQQQIEESLSRMKSNGLKTAQVAALEGMCIADTYLAACREVSEILSLEYPEKKAVFNERLKIIEQRMDSLTGETNAMIKNSGIESANVLASIHQSEFANWLNLNTVETFIGSDIETMANINKCLSIARDEDVKFIIANKQEGTSLADSLAEQLKIPVVVFSNFPETVSGTTGFDELLRANVRNLTEAAEL
ncbi:metal ABC transporter substrate-binding protein [Planctomycetota bacterium]